MIGEMGIFGYAICGALVAEVVYRRKVIRCRVPDDWLLKNKRPLLHGREVLREVLATWQARAKELPC